MALNAAFGDEYEIFQNDVEQSLEEPCFLIAVLQPEVIPMLGRRFIKRNPFDIQYFPSAPGNNAEMFTVAEKLIEVLDFITTPNGDQLHGTSVNYEIVDNVLHFFVNYNLPMIRPADGTMMGTLEIEVGTVNEEGNKFYATLQVTSQVGAQIDVSGPQTLTGVIPDGGVLSLTVTMPGAYAVTASLNGQTTDPVSVQIETSGQTYPVECVFYDPVLANNSWATIAKASASGKAPQLWSVLDTIDIVAGGEIITLEIVGFDHDQLTQGGTAGITFGFKNLMETSKMMNATATNAGGYTGSDLYDFTQNTLLPLFPSDLLAVMQPVNKLTSVGSQSTEILTESMTLFCFSEIEVNGRNPNSAPGEGAQYAAFADPENRAKTNVSVTMRRYWTRSPAVANDTGFCFVNSGGSPFETTADTLEGVCLGLCV